MLISDRKEKCVVNLTQRANALQGQVTSNNKQQKSVSSTFEKQPSIHQAI